MDRRATRRAGPPAGRTQAILLAGGRGSRLLPLTLSRAKPMVPFAGPHRLIDFTLSNCVNSRIRSVEVIGQYGIGSLAGHVSRWQHPAAASRTSIRLLPAAAGAPRRQSSGTADAVWLYQRELRACRSELTLVLAGDHVYGMDYRPLLAFHCEGRARATLAAVEVPLDAARAFGVLQTDRWGRVTSFTEKPEHPRALPGDPERALVSMGIYVFRTEDLVATVSEDAGADGSSHDFGRNIMPRLCERGELMAYRFREGSGPAGAYWRDVGTVDSYFAAQMDMLDARSDALLGSDSWALGPCDSGRSKDTFFRMGSSIVSAGCQIRRGEVERSVLSPGVFVEHSAVVYESVLLPGVRVGPHAFIRRAIIEEGIAVPAGAVIDGGVVTGPGDERLRTGSRVVGGWTSPVPAA